MNRTHRHYLIVCGTSKYQSSEEIGQLPSVEEDLPTVIDLLTGSFGYEHVLNDLQYLNPNGDFLKKRFADWLLEEERCDTDIVIFYYSGHGEYILGDRHYLLLENTNPRTNPQTALPTEDLVRPLNNQGVRMAQILYIIDTCFSQGGAGDVMKFASKAIQQYQPIKGRNIAIHTIAACRAKQEARQGIFSQVLKELLESWRENEFQEGYINPNSLVSKINEKIPPALKQNVVHSVVGSETLAMFFPFVPKTLQTWEQKRLEIVNKLFDILTKKNELNDSLFFINSFLLSSKFLEEFVLDKPDLREKLTELSYKPVIDGICPLIACSEWCRKRLLEKKELKLAEAIETWRNSVIQYRKGVDLDKIYRNEKQSWKRFEELITGEDLRVQIEIEPEVDLEKNTGQPTGAFHLNMNLWTRNQCLPLGRFAENEKLKPKDNNLKLCLENDDFLTKLIRKTRYSLPDLVKLELEFFLPFILFQESLEEISFIRGKNRKALGYEYPSFINSFERYFDEDFREVRDAIKIVKRALWDNDSDLDDEYYYIGATPSKSQLEKIEDSLLIAIWSQTGDESLVKEGELKVAEWKEWPIKIQNLRKKNRKVTLFWDDSYPKPSKRLRPLNTKVVE